MDMSVPVLAGAASTVIFAGSTLPMLYKARKTKDLGSYSLGNILLSNVGNLIHSIYVFSLPMGPIWLLHTFYLITTGLMLFWYLRFERRQDESDVEVDQPRRQGDRKHVAYGEWWDQLPGRKAAERQPAFALAAVDNSRWTRS
ncbi:MAG: hypothetical protein ACLFWD_12040 [Anaerolineales bacterium]